MGHHVGLTHRDPPAASIERIAALRVDQEAVDPERRGRAQDHAEVCRIVDPLGHQHRADRAPIGVSAGQELVRGRDRPPSEAGQHPSVEVVAGDPLQHLGPGGVDGDVGPDGVGERLGTLAVDQDRDQVVTGIECPVDHQIAFGHEQTSHVAALGLAPTSQDMIPQTLEHLDAFVGRVVDLDGAQGLDRQVVVARQIAGAGLGVGRGGRRGTLHRTNASDALASTVDCSRAAARSLPQPAAPGGTP